MFLWFAASICSVLLAACATSKPEPTVTAQASTDPYVMVNRLTWGATQTAVEELSRQGLAQYLNAQLRPQSRTMPVVLQDQIDSMTIEKTPLLDLVQQLDKMRKDADALTLDEAKKTAQQAYQQELSRLQREAATRHLLRALYSPKQVQEQMTWFWLNHFSVHQGKGNVRAMLGDYEENAIRAHALGNFRDLLGAVVTHPAMLRYLDNDQNAVGRINENFARELLELHTLGVNGGYAQRDVQELARVLTGHGINISPSSPALKK
jgi:uncharacterized protein (DUF1800 family)